MANIVYLTTTKLNMIKSQVSELLSLNGDKILKKIKYEGTSKGEYTQSFILLSICHELLIDYKAVTTEEQDGVINTIREENLQKIVSQIYKKYPTLQYPS